MFANIVEGLTQTLCKAGGGAAKCETFFFFSTFFVFFSREHRSKFLSPLTSNLNVDSFPDVIVIPGAVIVPGVEPTDVYQFEQATRLDGKTLTLTILPTLSYPRYLIVDLQIRLRSILVGADYGHIVTEVHAHITHRHRY